MRNVFILIYFFNIKYRREEKEKTIKNNLKVRSLYINRNNI